MLIKEGLEYESTRAVVYQRGSPQLVADLNHERNVGRLARAGVVNLFLLGVVILTYVSEDNFGLLLVLCVLSLAGAGGCLWLVVERYRRYHGRILSGCSAITGASNVTSSPACGNAHEEDGH